MLTRIICPLLAALVLLLPSTAGAKDMPHSQKFSGAPNFAKHYSVIAWSCGTECEQIAVVDTLTKAVYLAPFVAELGTRFRINSRLLIVNPPDAIEQVYGHEPPAWVTTRYYQWKAHRFVVQ
jgi:hypothetical protein